MNLVALELRFISIYVYLMFFPVVSKYRGQKQILYLVNFSGIM